MAEDTTRISPLKYDQAVIAHDTPLTDAQRAMFNKTFAPKAEAVVPAGADQEQIRAAKMFPSLHKGGVPKAAPAGPSQEEVRLAKMFPTIPGIQVGGREQSTGTKPVAPAPSDDDSEPEPSPAGQPVEIDTSTAEGVAFTRITEALPVEARQELLALHQRELAAQAKARAAQVDGWRAEVEADTELVGQRDAARAVVDRYGSPELQELLTKHGLGYHPALARFVVNVAQALQQVEEDDE